MNFVCAEGFGGAVATTRKSIRGEQELPGRFYRDVQAKSSTPYRTRFPNLDRRNTVISQRREPELVGDAPPKRNSVYYLHTPPDSLRIKLRKPPTPNHLPFRQDCSGIDPSPIRMPRTSRHRLRPAIAKEFYTQTMMRNPS
jgi:hypothetical protein